MKKPKVLLFCLLLLIGTGSIFCQVSEAETVENIKFTQYIESGKTYSLAKLLKDIENNSLTLESIPKSKKIKWKTNSSRLKIKNGKIIDKSNGTYKMYAVKGNKKYILQLNAVSAELKKISSNEVERIEIKETLAEKKVITDKAVIQAVCSKINSVKWKFSNTSSNKQKFGSTYSITFCLKSGKDKSYIVRKNMLQAKAYYYSSPKLLIFDYVDELYKSQP